MKTKEEKELYLMGLWHGFVAGLLLMEILFLIGYQLSK